MPTLNDISKELNISVATISRVLNNDSTLHVNNTTRTKILNYATKVGYITKISKNKPIIMIYHCISLSDNDYLDPFYKELLECVIERCKEENISTFIHRRGEIPQSTINVNGIIAIGTYNTNEIKLLSKFSSNITFLNSFPSVDKYDSIVVDDEQAIELMVDKIIETQAESVTFIGGEEFVPDEKLPKINRRKNHFTYYASLCNLTFDTQIGEYTAASGYNITQNLINDKNLPDAILCASDAIAKGVLDCLEHNLIPVPDKVQVIGFNDDKFILSIEKKLSSIHIHKNHMALFAVENILNRIKLPTSIHTRLVLPTTLIDRDTTR